MIVPTIDDMRIKTSENVRNERDFDFVHIVVETHPNILESDCMHLRRVASVNNPDPLPLRDSDIAYRSKSDESFHPVHND